LHCWEPEYEYVPAGHTEQDDDATAEYLPAGQLMHIPATEYMPPEHSEHDASPLLAYLPPGHIEHLLAPGEE